MKKKAHELEFISQIKRDGSGTIPVPEDYLKSMLENSLMKDEYFTLKCLSLSEKTFIASSFNSFVVRLKKPLKRAGKQTPFLSIDKEVILVGDLILQHSLTDMRSKNGPMKVCYGEFTMGRDDWAIEFVAYGFYIEFHDGGVYSLTQEGEGYSIPAKDCKIVK